jgi:hypothetical protein
MKMKFRSLLTVFCLFVTITSALAVVVFADTFSFQWTHVSGGVVDVLANDDGLNSDWNGSVYDNGRSKWNGSSAPIWIYDTTFSTSKVDLVTVSSTQWILNGWNSGLYAFAQPSYGGTPCSPDPTVDPGIACDYSDYGAVYINIANTPSDLDLRSAIIAHEIGHLVALRHTSSATPSIMHGSTADTNFRKTVQTYDINELNNKY